MEWDLGVRGLALLGAMALGFGVVARLVAGRQWSTPWLWVAAVGGYYAVGLLVSEAWFGWATEEDLQPNVDGLSFDEVLLLATLPCLAVVLLAKRLSRSSPSRRPRARTP